MGGWVLKICLLLVRHQANDFCYPHRKYKNMGQIRKPKSFLTVQIPLKLMWGYILSQSQPEEIVLWVNSLLTCMNPVFCPPVAQNVCSTGAEPHPKNRTRLWDIFLRSGVEICIFLYWHFKNMDSYKEWYERLKQEDWAVSWLTSCSFKVRACLLMRSDPAAVLWPLVPSTWLCCQ